MIIAFMGDTFERIAENKDVYSAKGKLELLADYAFLLKDDDKSERGKIFLYVVQPDEDEENDLSTWQGSIHRMQQLTKKQINAAETKIVKKVSVINDTLNESNTNLNDKFGNLKQKLNEKLDETAKKLDEKLDENTKKLDEMMASLRNLVQMTSESQNRV